MDRLPSTPELGIARCRSAAAAIAAEHSFRRREVLTQELADLLHVLEAIAGQCDSGTHAWVTEELAAVRESVLEARLAKRVACAAPRLLLSTHELLDHPGAEGT